MFAWIFEDYIQLNWFRLHEQGMIKMYLSHKLCLLSRSLLLQSAGATGNQGSFQN